jgi:hypothetical protein
MILPDSGRKKTASNEERSNHNSLRGHFNLRFGHLARDKIRPQEDLIPPLASIQSWRCAMIIALRAARTSFWIVRAVMSVPPTDRLCRSPLSSLQPWRNTMILSTFCLRLFVHAVVIAAPAWGSPLTARDDDKKAEKVLPAADARNHVGKECKFEMKVKASKNAEKRKTYFLDSEEDFHDANNLSVVISYDHADKFREAGIADPAEHFKDKTIHVTGKVIEEDDQIRIRVEDPKKIEVIEPK